RRVITRRRFVIGAASGAVGAIACGRAPAIQTSRPRLQHGVQSGDVQTGSAVVWARASEPARIVVEWDTTDRFASPHAVAGPVVGPDTDHAATVALAGLPAGQTIWYRVRLEREAERGTSAWVTGRFATPADAAGKAA